MRNGANEIKPHNEIELNFGVHYYNKRPSYKPYCVHIKIEEHTHPENGRVCLANKIIPEFTPVTHKWPGY